MNAGDAKDALQRLLAVNVDRDFGPVTRARFSLLGTTADAALWPPMAPDAVEIGRRQGKPIFRAGNVISFTSKAAIDVDGAPDAYHPDDHPGRDALAAAGHRGNWWGVVTDTDHIAGREGKGTPLIQGKTAPAFSPKTVGFLVSTTALIDNPEFGITDCRRYCNPDEVPGIVLPLGFPVKVRAGTKCRASYGGKSEEGVVFDFGPPELLGEMGTLMAERLGIPSNPRHGGVAGGVLYEVFL